MKKYRSLICIGVIGLSVLCGCSNQSNEGISSGSIEHKEVKEIEEDVILTEPILTVQNDVGKSISLEEVLQKLEEEEHLEVFEKVQTLEEDLNGDGKKEVLMSYGGKLGEGIALERNYLFVEGEAGYEKQPCAIDIKGYYAEKVELVYLDEVVHPYIYGTLVNGTGDVGYGIYEYTGEGLAPLFFEVAEGGIAEYELKDQDLDGKYDTMVSYLSDSNAFHSSVTAYHSWDGEDFGSLYYEYHLGEYPDLPEDVIRSYMDVRWLEWQYEANDKTRERLDQLVMHDYLDRVDVTQYLEQIYNSRMPMEREPNLSFETTYEDEMVKCIAVDLKEGALEQKVCFELHLEDETWKIYAIEAYIM